MVKRMHLSRIKPEFPHTYIIRYKGFEMYVLGFVILMIIIAMILWKERRRNVRNRNKILKIGQKI
jgi:hypothetical protein